MKPAQALIFALLGLSLGLSWFFARRGDTGPAPRSECLAHSNCQSSERCVVVPKGDGFATFGQCGELCTDDAQCPNGWKCRTWVDENQTLGPERGKGPQAPRVQACAHQSVGP
ncbi:MAG TPA: hypothetical protein VGE37_10715 [Archangium sp.]